MKFDSLYEETLKHFFDFILTQKQSKHSPKRPKMILNWINIESSRQVNALKIKVFDLKIGTPKYFSDPTQPLSQNSRIQPEILKITIKLVDIKNASQIHAQKMKIDRLYKETPKSFLAITSLKMTLYWVNTKNLDTAKQVVQSHLYSLNFEVFCFCLLLIRSVYLILSWVILRLYISVTKISGCDVTLFN